MNIVDMLESILLILGEHLSAQLASVPTAISLEVFVNHELVGAVLLLTQRILT